MPDAMEKNLFDLNEKDFIVDIDTYGYFLNEVSLKGVMDFVEKKYKVKFKDVENIDGAKAVENFYDNQVIIVKYWHKYNKIRDKFYLYKGAIYSYEFIGFMSVGHEIELYKYNLLDLLYILNKLTERKNILQKISISHITK